MKIHRSIALDRKIITLYGSDSDISLGVMKTFIACLALLLLIGSRVYGDGGDHAVAKEKVAELIRLLDSGGVRRIEIVYLPEEIATRTRLTPEMLEKQWRFKLIVDDFQSTSMQRKVVIALRASTFDVTEQQGDLRWGCSFYNEKNERVLSLYFDAAGKAGTVNAQPVLSNRKLVKVFKKICAGFRK